MFILYSMFIRRKEITHITIIYAFIYVPYDVYVSIHTHWDRLSTSSACPLYTLVLSDTCSCRTPCPEKCSKTPYGDISARLHQHLQARIFDLPHMYVPMEICTMSCVGYDSKQYRDIIYTGVK